MKRALLYFVATCTIMFGGSFALAHSDKSQCNEDESCWNCHTMGNRVCGVDDETGYRR